MFDEYSPRLSHAVTLAISGCAAFGYSGLYLSGKALIAGEMCGVLLVIFSIIIMVFLGNRERIAFYRSASHFAEQLSHLDQDQYQALGIAFPVLRIHWNGQPVQLIEDSDFTLEDFRRFMDDSDFRQISPERNWSSGRDRRTWLRIKNWLELKEYIHPVSAVGNHSWLWKGNIYMHLKERYLGAEPLRNLNTEIKQEAVMG